MNHTQGLIELIERLLPLTLAALLAWVVPAAAEDVATLTGTLKTVHDRGTIRIGHEPNLVSCQQISKILPALRL